MWIIVDGYNVIRQWPELARLDRADLQSGREALLAELREYRRAKSHRITVVFDGREQGDFAEASGQVAGVGVRYSRRGESADAVIARLAAEGGEGAVIVSSDREVQGAARRQRASSLTAEEFIRRLTASRMGSLKGGEEDPQPRKPKKGTARRLPKAERRRTRRLQGL